MGGKVLGFVSKRAVFRRRRSSGMLATAGEAVNKKKKTKLPRICGTPTAISHYHARENIFWKADPKTAGKLDLAHMLQATIAGRKDFKFDSVSSVHTPTPVTYGCVRISAWDGGIDVCTIITSTVCEILFRSPAQLPLDFRPFSGHPAKGLFHVCRQR